VFKSIIVPVDGSQPSNAAVDLAASLARENGARVTVCHVVSMPRPVHDAGGFAREEMMGEEVSAGHAVLEAAERRAKAAGVNVDKVLQSGSVAEGILAEAQERACDAIVMGSRGHTIVVRAVLGSATTDIINRSPIPVIVAPHQRAK
jgi:nucleotide-binding universal stress UspA family protein